jgi:exopolysaccharide biosynthesis polyprenyl glycosylphosphotransferase
MQAVYEHVTGKLPVNHLREGWLAYAEMHGTEEGVYKVKAKRIISFAGALFLMIITSPVTLLTMLAVRIESRGPVFFRQKRVGLNGKVFEIVKFRSMRHSAENGKAVWAVENDPRVTRVGKIIRKLRIDELPQIWNVIRGDMSLVGPRPERPEFVQELRRTIPFYDIRHVVKPGVTGWAQVNFKYGASKEDSLEKLQYDLYYVKNLSFFLDMRTMLKTIKVILFGEGAR